MYCRKCGKQINYDAPMCMECEEMEKLFNTSKPVATPADMTVAKTPEQRSKERMMFFGKALASTIVGTIAFILGILAFSYISVAYESYISNYRWSDLISSCVTYAFFGLGGAIPGLILGVSSVKCFCTAKKDGREKPVATLVCGLVGLVSSALTLIYVSLSFFMLILV